MFKPDAQFEKITDIDISFLKSKNIKSVILDLDNTLIDLDGNCLEGLKDWMDNAKQNGIKFCIATNSINGEKTKRISELLDIPFVHKSFKPSKIGIKKALKILKTDPKNTAEIGDQVFTDVWVSNRTKMFSILTQPIAEDRLKIDKIKRKMEKLVLRIWEFGDGEEFSEKERK